MFMKMRSRITAILFKGECMKNMRFLLVVVTLLLLNACSASGPKFTQVDPSDTDKFNVYFYRPQEWVASAISPTIIDNGSAISELSNGGYFKYYAPPGSHRFYTDSMYIDKPLTIEIKKGETYFFRLDFKSGVWTGTWMLNRVYADQALEELKTCNRQM